MPGRASLAALEYYAHPRNAFWPIMQALFGIARELPYDRRVRELAGEGVAVWDVLATCARASSLDSDIVPESVVANDFTSFLARHPGIQAIYFNGATARRLFERHVASGLATDHQHIARITLPSTSPANARLRPEARLEAWRVLAR